MTNFVEVTEIAGDMVSAEQVERIARRYYWAEPFCRGKDVLEVACGTGQGVGFLASIAKSVVAGDFSGPILDIAREHYGDRIEFRQFDAQEMPFADRSFDVLIIFEAIYYLPDAEKFVRECRRVLRPNGVLLIASANKDLYDFTPSAHSYRYFGVEELGRLLEAESFRCEFFGDTPLGGISVRQKMLRPVKMAVSRLNLMPKSMSAKKLVKRFVFGKLVPMPREIDAATGRRIPAIPLSNNEPDTSHKVIFCAARLV